MLDRDTVRRRLEGEGISYTEFSYMLLQANDYVELHQRYGCAADRRLRSVGQHHRRRPAGAPEGGRDGARADDPAGDRFGRQQVRQVDGRRQPVARPGDDEPVRLVPVLRQHGRRRRGPLPAVVHLPVARDELAELEQATAERPHERAAQRRLARELTTLVHGEARCAAVEHASQALFGRGELSQLDEPTLAAALREASVAELGPADPTPSPTCWWPADCRRARAQRGGRSPRAARTSTTSGSRATTGGRSRRTSCTAAGWCFVAASGISPASNALDDLSVLTHA